MNSNGMLVKLGETGVKTLDDLADLASDELIEQLGDQAPDPEQADAIIMAARAHWFDGEEASEASEGTGAQAEEAAIAEQS